MPSGSKNQNKGNFWQELKRRKVVHAITVYGAVAFVILQLVDIVKEPLRLPQWTPAFVIVLLCIGFVITVFLSWVYDITPAGVKKTRAAGAKSPSYQKTIPASGGWRIATYASLIVIGAMLAYNFIIKRSVAPDISRLEKSIAVLPFVNNSPNDSTTYFINSLTDEILNKLQKIKDFRVLSSTSTEQFKGSSIPSIPEIAKKLGVNYIVQGSGQKYGKNLQLSVHLIRANKESQLWTKSYKLVINNVNDIFSIQSDIAQSIATELETTLSPEEKLLIEKALTSNLTAYDFYERGRDELPEFWIECDDYAALDRAAKYYRKALKFDPVFAAAYVGLAEVNYAQHSFSPLENSMDSVLILADLALSYDDRLSEAYFVKGCYYMANGKKDNAITEFNKALELNHNDWMVYYGKAKLYEYEDHVAFLDNLYKALLINHNGKETPTICRMIGGVLQVTGFVDSAKTFFTRAFELDSDSSYYLSTLSGNEYCLGNFQESIEYCRRALMNRPAYYEVTERLANDLYYNGQYREALKYYKELKDISPQVAFAYWGIGNKNKAESLFKQIINYCDSTINSNRRNLYVTWAYYDRASVYTFNGDLDNAIKYLTKYFQLVNCELWMLTNIKSDPLFTSLRNESEFQELIKVQEIKFQAEHDKVKVWLEKHATITQG